MTQIPRKKESAAWVSFSSSDQARIHSITLWANSEDGQRQVIWLLESHLGMVNQVIIHLGTTGG